MSKNTTRGFTLIELLVVIAIIGILSAVVLASLNTARTKGSDAALKSDLRTVGTQAALFLSDNGNSYGIFDDGNGNPTACPAVTDVGTTVFHNTTVANAIAGALLDSAGGTATCISTGSAYAVAVSRPVGSNPPPSTYWCVDNEGTSCGVNSNALTGASCGPCDTRE